ncbi:MAG: hypothetical protein ABJA90_02740 [Ginsengibacter sp.]
MQSNSADDQDNLVLRFQIMVINTKELNKLLEDKDFDGITLQISQELGNNKSSQDNLTFKLIAYKHFASKKKQEQITDASFFANFSEAHLYKDVPVGDDGLVSHFGNLKLTRAAMQEDGDSGKHPYLVISPEHGTGEFESYIVCTAFFTDDLNASPPSMSLTRGITRGGGKVIINPSPPA